MTTRHQTATQQQPRILRIKPAMLKDRRTIDLLLRGGAVLQVVGR